MAEQNKTVTIAVIAVVGLAVVGLGAWYFLSDSAPPPTVAVEPPRPAPPPPPPENDEDKKRTRGPRKERVEEEPDTTIARSIRDKTADEMTPEEIKKRRGDTTKPRGAMP